MPTRRLLVWAALALLSLPACNGGDGSDRFPLREPLASPTSSDNLIVGLVGTLSGPRSWRGEDAFEGADLGVHVLNRTRPRGAPPYELVPLDDGGDASRSSELVTRLAELGPTVGIVYAGPPEGLPPAERALRRAGIPAVLCYGDLLGAGELGGHLFQTAPALGWEARRIAAYLVGDRGYATVGALLGRSADGRTARRALRRAVTRRGARFAAAGYGDGGGVGRALRALRRRRVEAVVVEGAPSTLSRVLRSVAAMGAAYRSTSAARIASAAAPAVRARRRASGYWRPQIAGFDLSLGPGQTGLLPGVVAAESYGRGVSYLPIPAMRSFRSAFRAWWDARPTGWESRAYDAVRMVGWAARRAGQQDDLAEVLESLRARRFSGLPVRLSRRDHAAVDAVTVGLWVVARPDVFVRERSRGVSPLLPWVPLARTFSHHGLTDVLPGDLRWLFSRRAARAPRPPRFAAMRFGVTTPRSDPVH
jgi:ABC-type branched-subunit amino acid transport system substrate-binding protein